MARRFVARCLAARAPPAVALLGAALLARPRVRFANTAGSPLPAAHAAVRIGNKLNRAVLVRNGKAVEPWISKEKLLKEHVGAYTTARTVERTSVFELSMHCSRLHETASAVLQRKLAEDESSPQLSTVAKFLSTVGPKDLKPLICHEVLTAVKYLEEGVDASLTSLCDYQVTILLTWDTAGPHTPVDRGFDIFTYVQPLPLIEAMVDIEAHRADRPNPTIKDVQWVQDRDYLEQKRREAGVNEIVMFDGEGHITEGLSTNFFAVRASDGAVCTAPDDRVLAGTVRKVVLEVAREHGIPVVMQTPSVHHINGWDSAFIASTSRLVKPVRTLAVPELSVRRDFPADNSGSHQIEELVLHAVKGHSELLEE